MTAANGVQEASITQTPVRREAPRAPASEPSLGQATAFLAEEQKALKNFEALPSTCLDRHFQRRVSVGGVWQQETIGGLRP